MRRLHRTGIGRYARNILAACAAEEPHLAFVAVVNEHADIQEIRALAPSARCVVAPAAQYSPQELLRAPCLGTRIDVWHSPHPYHLGLNATYNTVLSLLDLTQVNHPFGLKNWLAREPLRALIWAACKRAASFTAISEATRDMFAQQMGIHPERISLTRLAPDPQFAQSVPAKDLAQMRRRWSLDSQFVLYIGMAQPHKNLLGLIRAIARLHTAGRRQDPQLAVAGPIRHGEIDRLTQEATKVGFRGSIRWLGWLPDEALRLAYRSAAVLVLPSFSEGFGLTLLEAMQCGTPCVAADIPVLREVAGAAAVFVDPHSSTSIADGIALVLDDEGLVAQLRQQGYANLQRFSWQEAAQGTIAAYYAAAQTRT